MKHSLKDVLHGIMYLNARSWLLVLFGDIMRNLAGGSTSPEMGFESLWFSLTSGSASLLRSWCRSLVQLPIPATMLAVCCYAFMS